ncbi:MAG TPA: hypothetical protein ENK18_11600 [Deltaproteobacteria bacterium]|nr:hypothetical protein [Deltaproteobacteria bacterium]
MTDERLEENLRLLGIKADRIGLISLLPLVQVAWADGQIQEAERALLLEIGERHGLIQPGDEAVIATWLSEEPSPYFQDTARKLLLELVRRASLPEGLDRGAVVAWCWAIAAAAGGIFGSRLMAISNEERDALDEIAEALGIVQVPEGWIELIRPG